MRTYFQHLELQNIDFELLCWSMRDENFIRVKELPFNVQLEDFGTKFILRLNTEKPTYSFLPFKKDIVINFDIDLFFTKDIASKSNLNSQ